MLMSLLSVDSDLIICIYIYIYKVKKLPSGMGSNVHKDRSYNPS